MTIPLFVFLIGYAALLAVFLVFIAIHVYHLVATASLSFASFIFTLFIFLMCFVVLMFTFSFLRGVQWDYLIRIPFITFQ